MGHRRTGEVLAVIVAHGIATWLVFVVFSTLLEKLEHLEHRYRAITSAHYRRAVETACFEGTQGMHKIVGVT